MTGLLHNGQMNGLETLFGTSQLSAGRAGIFSNALLGHYLECQATLTSGSGSVCKLSHYLTSSKV